MIVYNKNMLIAQFLKIDMCIEKGMKLMRTTIAESLDTVERERERERERESYSLFNMGSIKQATHNKFNKQHK